MTYQTAPKQTRADRVIERLLRQRIKAALVGKQTEKER